MKKFIAIILTFVYLTTSVGATVHFHYCMDKLVDWEIGQKRQENKACTFCGMTKTTNDKHCGIESNGCCKDEQKQIKLHDDQKASEAPMNLTQIFIETKTPVFSNFSFQYISSITEVYPLTHAPPRTQDVALFVLNCDFRI